MSDYQQIPEAIRSTLAIGAASSEEDLADLAANFASLCSQSNERLRRCAEYLRRGMRSEAIHLAACQPDLLEMTTALQAVDGPDWERLCLSKGLSVPPRLQAVVLPALREAIIVEQALEPLLARHRTLELAKAAVTDRLRVLRALGGRDPENLCWKQQIQEFESARLREIRSESMAAFKNRDAQGVERLLAEIADASWRLEVPNDLRLGLQKTHDGFCHERAMEKLDGLLNDLLAAQGAGSCDTCATLMTQWQQVVEAEQLALPSRIQRQVRPVAAWLSSEQRRKSVIEKMRFADPVLREQAARIRRRRRYFFLAGIGCLIALTAVVYFILHAGRH